MMIIKKGAKSIRFSWIQTLISMAGGMSLAFSLYFLILQPDNVISKTRLAITLGMGFLFFVCILAALHFDVLNLRTVKVKVIKAGAIISFIFSLLFILITFGLNELPYNLFLLPKLTLEITPLCDDADHPVTELKYFYNGLSIVSYSAFQQRAGWERTKNTLKNADCENASLFYKGWLVGEPYIAFKTQAESGTVNLSWNGVVRSVDLFSNETGELRLTKDLGLDYANKATVLFTFAAAFAILIFPLGLQVAGDLLSEVRPTVLEKWFAETGSNLYNLVFLVLFISTLSTAVLAATPLFIKDKTPLNYVQGKPAVFPNIILILSDSLGAQDMSMFGYPLPTTPNLEKITRDWTVYTNANTMSTCTVRIFPSLISGRYPYFAYPLARYGQLMASSPEWVNLMQMLSDAGYTTWWHSYKTAGMYHATSGIDHFLFSDHNLLFKTWYFPNIVRHGEFPFYPLILEKAAIQSPWDSSGDAPEKLGNMLASGKFQEPFFIYMHYRGAHFGSYYSGKYLGRFLPVDKGMTGYYEQNALLGAYPPENQALVDKLKLRYDEAILYEDDSLGALIEKLKQTGYYDSSLIIIAGDHGQVFDNGFATHCTPLISYAETHIPLLVKYPHQTEGKRVNSLVTLLDIAPTILETAGIGYSDAWFDGVSLANAGREEKLHDLIFVRSDYLRFGKYFPSYAVLNDQYKLTLRLDGYYLYNYINDPGEKRNLINKKTIDPEVVNELKDALDRFVQANYLPLLIN
jgi:arylsulfatase A-like enzyme